MKLFQTSNMNTVKKCQDNFLSPFQVPLLQNEPKNFLAKFKQPQQLPAFVNRRT